MILNDPISGSSRVFAIVTSLPAGIPGSAIRYGAVAAQGLTGGGGYFMCADDLEA